MCHLADPAMTLCHHWSGDYLIATISAQAGLDSPAHLHSAPARLSGDRGRRRVRETKITKSIEKYNKCKQKHAELLIPQPLLSCSFQQNHVYIFLSLTMFVLFFLNFEIRSTICLSSCWLFLVSKIRSSHISDLIVSYI